MLLKGVRSVLSAMRSRYRSLFGIWWLAWFVRLVLPVVAGVAVGDLLGGDSAVRSFWSVLFFFVANEYIFRGAIAFSLPLVLFVLSCLLFLLTLLLPIAFNYVAGASESARLLLESRYPGFLFLVDDVESAFGSVGGGISWWLVAFYLVTMLIYLTLSVAWYDDLQHYVSRRTRAASPLWFIGVSLLAFVSAGDVIGLPGGVGHLLSAAVGVIAALTFSAGYSRVAKFGKVYRRRLFGRLARSGKVVPAKASKKAVEPVRAAASVPVAIVAPQVESRRSKPVVAPVAADVWSDDEYEIPVVASVVDLSGPVEVVVGDGPGRGSPAGSPPSIGAVHAVGALPDRGGASPVVPVRPVAPPAPSAILPTAPITSPARMVDRAATDRWKDDDVRYDRSAEDPEAQALRVMNYVVSAVDTADWNLMSAASDTVASVWRTALGMPAEGADGAWAHPVDGERTLAISVLSEIWKRPLGEDFVRAMYRWDDLDAIFLYLIGRREAGSDLSVRSTATIDMEMVPFVVAPRSNDADPQYGHDESEGSPLRELPDVLDGVSFFDMGHEDVGVGRPGFDVAPPDVPVRQPVVDDSLVWAAPPSAAAQRLPAIPVGPAAERSFAPSDLPSTVDEPILPMPVLRPSGGEVAPAASIRPARPVTEPTVFRRPSDAEPYVRVSEEISYVADGAGGVRGEGPDGVDVEEAVGYVEFHLADGVAGDGPESGGGPPHDPSSAIHASRPGADVEVDPASVVVGVSMDEFLVRQQAMDLPQLQAILQSEDGELAMSAATFAQRFRARLVAVGYDPTSMESFLKYVDRLAFHHNIGTGEDVRAFLFGLVDLFPTSEADKGSARDRMAYVFCDSWRRDTHAVVERLLADHGPGRRTDIGGDEVDALIRTMERMGRIFISDPSAQNQFSLRVERLRDLRSKLFGDGPAEPASEIRVDDLRVGTGLALRGDLDHPAQTDLDDFLALAQAHSRISDMIARESLYSGREAMLHPLQTTVKDIEVQGSRVLLRLAAASDKLRDRRKMPRSAPVLDRLLDGLGDDATLFRQIVERQREELADEFVPTADRLARVEADLDAVRLGVASQRAAESKGLRERVEEQWAAHTSDPFSAIARRLEAQSVDVGAVASEWRLLDLRERTVDGLRVFAFDHGTTGDRVVLVPLFGFGVPWVRRGDLLVSEVDGLSSFDLRAFVRSHRLAFSALQPSDVKLLLFSGELSRHADSDLLSSRLQPPSSGVLSSEYARHDSDWWRGCVVLRDDLVGLGRGVDRRSGMASHLADLLAEPRVATEIPA